MIVTRTVSEGGTIHSGILTELTIVPVSKKSRICFAAITAQFSSLSGVDAPRCGIASTFGWQSISSSGKSVTYFFTFAAVHRVEQGKSFSRGRRARS